MRSDFQVKIDTMKSLEGEALPKSATGKMRVTIEGAGEELLQVKVLISDSSAILKPSQKTLYNIALLFNKVGLGRWKVEKQRFEVDVQVDGKVYKKTVSRDVWINKMSLAKSRKAHALVTRINKKVLGGDLQATDYITKNKETIVDIFKRKGAGQVYKTFFLTEGKKISHLKMDELGSGSYKTARLVYDVELKKMFAYVTPKYKLKKREKSEIENETEIWNELKSNGVDTTSLVQMRSVRTEKGKEVGAFWEYCEGGDLSAEFQKTKGMRTSEDEKTTYGYLLQLVEGLVSFSVPHLDIKPDNVYLKGGKVKIGDIGLVVRSGAKPKYGGTPVYSAPEMIRHKLSMSKEEDIINKKIEKHTQAQDAWSLGVMLYEYATGESFIDRENDRYEDMVTVTNWHQTKIDGLKLDEKIQDGDLRDVIKGLLTVDVNQRMKIDDSRLRGALKKLSGQ